MTREMSEPHTEPERRCGTCGTIENFPADKESELRPYGPGGSLICARCAFATPESEAQVAGAFGAQLDAAQAVGDGVATLTEHGPEPGVNLRDLGYDNEPNQRARDV